MTNEYEALGKALAEAIDPVWVPEAVAAVVEFLTSDEAVEASARAGHEYLRAMRPVDHGPYESWEELDESYREYLRGIQRAAFLAAVGGSDAD